MAKELVFHSSESDGAEGARRKAWVINRESGYNIISIKHRSMAPVGVFPAKPLIVWGKSELGYEITAVKPIPGFFSRNIPSVMEA